MFYNYDKHIFLMNYKWDCLGFNDITDHLEYRVKYELMWQNIL